MFVATSFRALVLAGTALTVLAAAAPVSAYSARLSWSAPDSCPDVEALRDSVERLLGEPLTDGPSAEASAAVTEDPDGRFTLRLDLRTEEEQGSRSLRTESCQSALEVVAFGIALALNPELRAEPPSVVTWPSEPASPEPPAAPPPAPPAEPVPAAPPPARVVPPTIDRPPPASSARRPWAELWVAVAAIGDSSLLPDPALGLGVAAETLLGGRVRIGAGPHIFLPQDERLPSGGGGLFSLWAVQGYACGALGAGLEVCPLFQYGVLRGQGRGVTPPLEQTGRVYAPGAAVLGSYPLSAAVLARAGLSGVFPLNRDVFVVRDGVVHRTPVASVGLSLGIATRAF